MKRSIKSNQRQMRLIALKVDGTGTAALSGPDSNLCTLTDNGTGDYSIAFNNVFAAAPVISALPLTDDVNISQHSASTASGCRIECRSVASAESQASLVVDSAIKFHSELVAADGNDITIELADAVSAGSEAIASVSDAGAIVINIEGGVSTATQVHAAIMADSVLANEARNFISSEVLVGATAINTAAAANLAGGADAVAAAAVDADFDLIIIGSDVEDKY